MKINSNEHVLLCTIPLSHGCSLHPLSFLLFEPEALLLLLPLDRYNGHRAGSGFRTPVGERLATVGEGPAGLAVAICVPCLAQSLAGYRQQRPGMAAGAPTAGAPTVAACRRLRDREDG